MVAVLCAWQGELHERRRRELALISRSDSLTGCLNRRGFQERLASELGVVIHTSSPVRRILTDNSRVTGIELQDGTRQRIRTTLRVVSMEAPALAQAAE